MKDTKALLKEAIADAKAVRETALTQAKLALEEAFTPRLQSMFATKLQEAYDEEEELDEMKDMADENMDIQADIEEITQEEYADHGNEMDEIDLDEILAELENELNEAKGEEDEEEIEAEEDVEDMEDDVKEDEDEEKEVKDLSMDELENLIKDIISQEVGGDGEVEGEGYEDEVEVDAMDMGGDAEVEAGAEDFELEESLDAILAELLGEESLDERKKYGGNKGDVPAAKRGDKKDTAEEEGVEDYKKKKMEEELQLALEAVQTLRTELNEVNLLNAKLLYVNKIFKAKNLNESQKLKVVKAFDKAETAKEAKLVYESLSETFNAKAPKSQIRESLGFASKPAGVAAKQTIVESNDFITRMQKLANIK
jgi:hypothetical protein